MSLRIEPLNDGTGRLHYISDGHVVLTGPITGGITTADGTVYDVSPTIIEVADEHGMEVAEQIGQRYMLEGHPDHEGSDVPFVHVPQPVDPSLFDGPTMGLAVTVANSMLSVITAAMPYTNLHAGATGATGANEMSGSTRQATSWNTPASGSATNSSSLTYTTPGTVAATDFGGWSASTAGTFGAGGQLTAAVTAATITVAAGGYTLGQTSTSR